MNKFSKKIIIAIVILVSLSFAVSVTPTYAAEGEVNLFGDDVNENIALDALDDTGLSKRDPRIIVANIVRIFLGLLGVLAVVLIMYGGFIWMNAGGSAEKIEKARKIITNAAIGLLIILASFAIVTYITSRFLSATGAIDANASCESGQTRECGCDGQRICIDNKWSECIGSDCGGNSGGSSNSCDSNKLTQECDADNTFCDDDEYCSIDSCTCVRTAGYGENCDADLGNSVCDADNSKCGDYLACDPGSCICTGTPVIEMITPSDGSINTLMSISGRYFRDYEEAISKVMFWDGSDFTIQGKLANEINPLCGTSWTDSQIIVIVPTGTQTGAIKVIASSGEDTTDNNVGPKIKDFEINAIVRPGICKISPSAGDLDNIVEYFGINLENSTAYFGNSVSNMMAQESSFTAVENGTAKVPNIAPGRTTTFVKKSNGVESNFLNFTKLGDTSQNLMIISFDPEIGTEGSYVTIYGSGFGNSKGNSSVYFGEGDNAIEADYSFPKMCSKSIWTNDYLMVKVPEIDDGNYKIQINVKSETAISVKDFKVNKDFPIIPGICRMEPSIAQPNEEIVIWGEYFGKQDDNSKVRFYQNKDRGNKTICMGGLNDGDYCISNNQCIDGTCEDEIIDWSIDRSISGEKPYKVITKIPQDAITGPVGIVKGINGLVSNSMYLTIGNCNEDSQCGSDGVCCGFGTAEEGRCKDSIDECFGTFNSCVFEWDFSTDINDDCPAGRPNKCDDGNCCATECQPDIKDISKTVCLDFSSCSGVLNNQCLDSLLCPNSPGNCSANAGKTLIAGSCDCQYLGCADCDYNADLNKCINKDECNLNTITMDASNNPVEQYCKEYEQEAIWHLNSNQTCPTGYTKHKDNNSICVDLNSTCSLCENNLKCFDVDGSDIGLCGVQQNICPNNYSCNANEQCAIEDGTCECCCDKTQNAVDDTNPACCAPLTCNNECGTGGDFGYCSGCGDVGSTQEEQDLACSCDGFEGKFCDVNNKFPEGICNDCSQITDPEDCSKHASCCVDGENGNACRGIGGSDKFEKNGLNYCSYFRCEDDCTNPYTLGEFNSVSICSISCGEDKAVGGDELDEGECGCLLDSDCNDIETLGCGIDGCCYARPEVVENMPVSSDVCRNNLISVQFDQKMDVDNSMVSNMILAGDYGSSLCPSTTTLLVKNWTNLEDGLLNKLARKIFIGKEVFAGSDDNYCAVRGVVYGNDTYVDGKTVSAINFSPNNLLDTGIKYYAIVKGDQYLDSTSGVVSYNRVGINGNNSSDTSIFNGIVNTGNVSYPNAHIWSFTVGSEVCLIEAIKIEPSQYLFQKPKETYSYFTAKAYTLSGKQLVPSLNYAWSLEWETEDASIVDIEVNSRNSNQVTGMAENRRDAQTIINAKAVITTDNINQDSTIGTSITGSALVYVFLCENPWPQVNDLSAWPYRWQDDEFNCDIYPDSNDPSYCIDNNFEFYYCRDDNSSSTKDDLPAFMQDPVIRARNDKAIIPLLKEYYFFHEAKPSAPKISGLNNSNSFDGKEVDVTWSGVNKATYKLYYGKASGKYDDYIFTDKNLSGTVSNLENGVTYYIAITATNEDGVESDYSVEESIVVRDVVSPSVPNDLAGLISIPSNNSIQFNWQKDNDAKSYLLEYGPTENPAVSVNIGFTDQYRMSDIKNISTQSYYINLRAIDSAGNLSTASKLLCEAGCLNECLCIVR